MIGTFVGAHDSVRPCANGVCTKNENAYTVRQGCRTLRVLRWMRRAESSRPTLRCIRAQTLLRPYDRKVGIGIKKHICEANISHRRYIASRSDISLQPKSLPYVTRAVNRTAPKPPLCKGRWHGVSRDGGIVQQALVLSQGFGGNELR